MILERYYIAAPALWTSADGSAADGILTLPVDTGSRETVQALYRSIHEKPSQSFCLFLQGAGACEEASADDLIAFFFLPHYHKYKGCPVLVLPTEPPGAAQTFVRALGEASKLQGFPQLVVKEVPAGNGAGVLSCSHDKADEIKATYRSMLLDPEAYTTGFFITVRHPGEVSSVNQLLEEEEAVLRQQEPALYQLWQQYRDLHGRLLEAELCLAAARQEIEGQAGHLEVLRSQSQAVDLQHYYTHEYEILPTWYKRLGHVIKVMTGKRSLRSLFNDNVKKYKQ